jgi:hypothetical protein
MPRGVFLIVSIFFFNAVTNRAGVPTSSYLGYVWRAHQEPRTGRKVVATGEAQRNPWIMSV